MITKNKAQIETILTQEIAVIDTAQFSFLKGLQEKVEEKNLEKTPDEDTAVEQKFVNAEEFGENSDTSQDNRQFHSAIGNARPSTGHRSRSYYFLDGYSLGNRTFEDAEIRLTKV